jgi:hypothetical protein
MSVTHEYTWGFDDDVPEELLELGEGTYKGHTFQLGEYDGDLYGAIDGAEFVVGWARGGYADAYEVLELNGELVGNLGQELAEIVAEVAVMDAEDFNKLFDN